MKNLFSKLNDSSIQSLIGYILRIGVLLSSGIVLFGGLIYLSRHGYSLADYKVFHDESARYADISKLVPAALSFHGRDIMQLGLIVLIATPIARVLFSALGFLLEKDYLYVGICLLVLAIIGFSMLNYIAG